MGDFSTIGGQAATQYGGQTSDTSGVTLTTGIADTKGLYAEITSSTTETYNGLIVTIIPTNLTDDTEDALIDIAIGAASSEEDIIPNLYYSGGRTNTQFSSTYYVPITIPAGTRISARGQAEFATKQFEVTINGLISGLGQSSGLSSVDTYGADTADSGGLAVDPGGTANTKGTPTEITSSTTAAYKGFWLDFGSNSNSATSDARWLVDILIGSSTEEILIGDLFLHSATNSDNMLPRFTPFIPMDIPAGSRIAIQAQCTLIDATDRVFSTVFHGVK